MFDLWKAQRSKAKLDDDYRKKAASLLKANKHEDHEILLSDWHFDGREAEEIINALVTRKLVSQANKLDLPIPSYPRRGQEDESQFWYYSEDGSQRILTSKGRLELRDSIRREKRERFDARARWVTLITGLIGAAIGLVTVLANLLVRIGAKH